MTAGIWKGGPAPLGGVTLPVRDRADDDRIVARVGALMVPFDNSEARLTAAADLHGQFAAAALHHLDT